MGQASDRASLTGRADEQSNCFRCLLAVALLIIIRMGINPGLL